MTSWPNRRVDPTPKTQINLCHFAEFVCNLGFLCCRSSSSNDPDDDIQGLTKTVFSMRKCHADNDANLQSARPSFISLTATIEDFILVVAAAILQHEASIAVRVGGGHGGTR